MAKRTPIASSTRPMHLLRSRYYAAINSGMSKAEAGRFAVGSDPIPAAEPPAPVQPIPVAPNPQPLVHAAASKKVRRRFDETTPVNIPKTVGPLDAPVEYDENLEPMPVVAAPKETVQIDKPPVVVVPDDLTQIHGIGAGTVKKLNDAGIISLAQIASWSADEAATMDQKLVLHGRVSREDWVGQAKALTKKG